MMFVPTKGENLCNIIMQNIIWANQKIDFIFVSLATCICNVLHYMLSCIVMLEHWTPLLAFCHFSNFIFHMYLQACELFLKNRSAIIKYNIRQLKFEGATSLYVRCLCNVFFTSLSETGREFHKAFPELQGCFSCKFRHN